MGYKSGAKKHIHRYFRNVHHIWACGWPDCTHFMPTNIQFMMEGRQSICWICGERMILSRANLRQERPTCNECSLKAAGMSEDAIQTIDNLIQQRLEKEGIRDRLDIEDAKTIINKPDDDCMTPSICKSGKIEELCDNCREKLMY